MSSSTPLRVSGGGIEGGIIDNDLASDDRRTQAIIVLLKGGWPIQARFWLEWGSSTAGQLRKNRRVLAEPGAPSFAHFAKGGWQTDRTMGRTPSHRADSQRNAWPASPPTPGAIGIFHHNHPVRAITDSRRACCDNV